MLKSTTLEDTRIRAENARALDALFAPAGVAVIGATDRSGSVGRAVFENLQCGYTGHLLPVNPNRETVFGVPCVADPSQTEKPVELAVIAVPAAAVPDAVIASARAGCRAAVVLTAGFQEVGGDGVERALRGVELHHSAPQTATRARLDYSHTHTRTTQHNKIKHKKIK